MYAKSTWTNTLPPSISSTYLNNLETQYDQAATIGEIKMYCGTTAPTNYFLCNGTSKSAAAYPALFAITSHYFGGNDTWFHLPDLRRQWIVGYSTTAGSTYGTIGITGGTSGVSLTESQLPAHTHVTPSVDLLTPGAGAGFGIGSALGSTVYTDYTGGGQPHENRPQSVVLNFIIRYQ
jgi:microcystin-dependent protein